VHQLVAQHVFGLAEPGRERQDDAPFEVFGDAADAIRTESRENRVLRKVGVTGVQDHRLARRELVLEHTRQPGVPALGEPCGVRDSLLLGRVVIEIQMRGSEHPELEAVVADLVTSELLGSGRRDARQRQRHGPRKNPSCQAALSLPEERHTLASDLRQRKWNIARAGRAWGSSEPVAGEGISHTPGAGV
jgi:hypothetical protein